MDENKCDAFVNQTEAQERAHLHHVTGLIAAEMAEYAGKVDARHDEVRTLVRDLQESRDEMDHIEKANMRQSVNVMTRVTEHSADRQRRLGRMVDSPYFARIDVAFQAGKAEQPIYIGMHAFQGPSAETQLVHDWRAPVASMFYEYELGPAAFDAPSGQVTCDIVRKRQYRIDSRELVFMLDTALSIQDDILQAELSRASDEGMKNIVATIQRDQNAIIRNDQAHSLIIQGAAGSGKTSIALHRIAFLLYRHRETLRSEDILIISPNKVFASYISRVLPELGEDMIQETTMEELAARELGHKVRFETFADQVARLLTANQGLYARRVAFKASVDFLRQLDAYIHHVRTTNVTPLAVKVGLYTVSADWIAAQLRSFQNLPINSQITSITDAIVAHLQERYDKRIVGRDRTVVRNGVKRMFADTTLAALYKKFYLWLDEPAMFNMAGSGAYEYNDVFPMIYLRRLLEPVTPSRHIQHVVIDEMQDYTPVQYRVLADLYPCRKTILGDCNQSVSPVSSSSLETIERVLDACQRVFMHKSYRSTLEITQLTQTIVPNADLIPIARHGERPRIITCRTEEDEITFLAAEIARFHASEHRSLAIICKTQEHAGQLYERLAQSHPAIQLLDTRSTHFANGVMLATAYLAKGLEFDQVIVPFASDEHYRSHITRQMLYVACTRAMHRLTLTCTGEPSSLLAEAIEKQVATVGSA